MEKVVKALKKEMAKYRGLDFVGANVHKLTNIDHPYPATMIPQLPDLFLDALRSSDPTVKNTFDPFMGSGTTLVEALSRGINGLGVDMNPLSVLISKVETTYLDPKVLRPKSLAISREAEKKIYEYRTSDKYHDMKVPHFKKINYWFHTYVIYELQIIKNIIKEHTQKDDNYRNFYYVVLSKTIRYVSNVRNGEFKMYRINKHKVDDWQPKVFARFDHNLWINVDANDTIGKFHANISTIWGNSAKLPDDIKLNSFDSLITSPPYGDSRTTVAYGQFSRLSLQWLDLHMKDESDKKLTPEDIAMKVDKYLLGGHKSFKEIEPTRSNTLNHYLRLIAQDKPKRALQVYQFYEDLDKVLKEVAIVMKPGSYQFWVTGNRTVDGYRLPTDEIITELFKTYNINPVSTRFYRDISNKRMPARNSPTNHKGKKSRTMSKEAVSIYKTGNYPN